MIGLGIAAVAIVVALVATLIVARQRPKAVRAARARHPASTPPISISLVREGRDAYWRLDVLPTVAPVSVDILSYRPSGRGSAVSSSEWENAPIVDPVELQPGGWAVLPHAVAGRAPQYDVVMGWTEHRPDGERTDSGTFRVHEAGPLVPVVPGRRGGWIVAAIGVAAVLVTAGVLVLSQLGDELDDDTDDETVDEIATAPPPTTAATIPTAEPSVPTTPVPTVATTSVTATTRVTTTVVATTVPAPTTLSGSSPSPSTSSTNPTTIAPGEPSVTALGRIEDCRFGPDCLVVGFAIENFDTTPSDYVCEFGDGERVPFTFVGAGAETACSARSADPSITIEVDGVRSNTVTPDALTP